MKTEDNIEKKENWFVRNHGELISIGITITVFIVAPFFHTRWGELIMHALLSISVGSTVYASFSITKIRKDNIASNNKIIEIITDKIENKIYRKLVSTNAIISNRDDKLALTARVIDDFPSLADIKNGQKSINPENSESIDLVRMLSYQNLILTPKYLDYFFYRKDSVKKATRIVVLDKDQLNGKICQATLTYLFLSARYGYETYIIPELRFKAFLQQYCKIDGKSKAERDKQEETLRMIKGNPFILKLYNGTVEYAGEYTDFQANHENYGLKKNFSNQEYWVLLERLINNSIKITAESTGFAEDIKTKIQYLKSHELV